MSEKLAARLDLEQAWKRAKWDLKHRNFVSHPFEVEIIESSLAEWLERLRGEIAAGAYSPKACETFDYPKPGFQVRPAARLDLQDYVVYCALGQAIMDEIHSSLRALANIDYSYQLQPTKKALPWFKARFTGWGLFRRLSLRRIEKGAAVVLFSDLVGFYENIELERLKYMLMSAGVDNEVLTLLMKCLRKWAGPRARGIPQGTSVSDLLAKLYLEPVDRRLQRDGFEHLRYVDDIRVFCDSLNEAKKAIRSLSSLMRERGLNLQSAKTQIYPAEKACAKLLGVIPEIEALEKKLVGEAKKQFGWMSPYLYPGDLKKLHDELAEGATREAVDAAFQEHVLARPGAFDPSLFHYLLKRLGAIGSPLAIDNALDQLRERPEETVAVLEYLKDLGSPEEAVEAMIEYLESPEAIYEFQRFEILRWFTEQDPVPCSEAILSLARKIARERGEPLWLRSYAIALVGRCGDRADLEALEEMYASSTSHLEGAIFLCALERMHKARRNAVYGRAGGDSFLAASAIRWVQARPA